ncbi:protein Skeletor, isoforms D/E-like isoform X4 [Ostrinia furnacalis]|uniref:protein Skeletor, isoforms D/E-like isoform X1 n=1 Tax=Ostrinia furnacalis TaxID=93504 RepID=UPI00103B203E|nr:protein Skeletor, isoforms D/E-like isoform X1 [Ostrinia furnacalis]XP_028176405.1 protein Skeletor, isoforms D/E-like isoform X2 [Ostrinia furnacalis]XP_028176406.1 protein Skeletor, isoforms D/E-like isoform X3 [Ostrinia furnacalis]XP_028176407.1 protein Skeletor, isoforms D/E-like isoform X4 [Ostrinia furnacalis]
MSLSAMRSAGALLLLLAALGAQARYHGREVGALSQLHHGVRGTVFAVDARTLFIHDFHYDGVGPAAFFYVGTSKTPNAVGATRLRDERGGTSPLRRYRGEGVTISLPDGVTLRDVKWFSVWCDEYAVNFGDVSIPRDLEYPKPAKVGALRGVHGVSSDAVVVVDAQTLLIPNFSYDGEAPDAKFWVGRGETPSPQGIRIPDENGKEAPLRKYDKKTIVLTLPGELTVFDIGHFAVWCEAFTVNFGHVVLPRAALANVPPSLKMLGVSPQSKLNCEVLHDELAFEVRWAVAGDSIVLQLVAKLEDGEYMSFGISGDPAHSQMVGSDVAVAWVDKDTLKGYAVDYYLDAKSQCAGVRGSCPDERLGEKTNSVRLLNAALVNGYSIVTYQRALRAADELDRAVLTNASQPIVWALGPLNSRNEVSYHHHFTKGDKFIEFGRPPVWNCPMPEGEEEHAPEPPRQEVQHHSRPVQENTAVIKPNPVPTPKPVAKAVPWEIPAIQCYEPPDGVFYAQMGPTGGKQGYSAITGHVGWGISWYINGLLIPEINVVRGRKYTFVVEGGHDASVPARYHPFYITNDPVGGYYHKNDQEKKGIEIYAGVRRSRAGELIPTGVGRLCNWTPDNNGPEADEYPSFGAYQRSLTLVCEEGNPGVVTWIPDRNTPDTVYYQCFTHRHLGWKINVHDECDESEAEESRVEERVAAPDDLRGEESIQVRSRLPPDQNFLDRRQKVEKIIEAKPNYDDFSRSKGDGGRQGDAPPRQEFELPVSQVQIKEVIRAVEGIESEMRDEMRRNQTRTPTQYRVHEDVNEAFLPERPVREGDEYVVGRTPETFFLPPNQQPLTLQSVMRPNQMNKPGGQRPPFRRPVPPEIKLRRPPPGFPKGNNYPLQMPGPHNPNGMHKKVPPKHRGPMNQGRPMPPGVPPMKVMPPLSHPKPSFGHNSQKHGPKIPDGPVQSIVVGKPGLTGVAHPQNFNLQAPTLNLGQPDIIMNQVVRSQITLPGAGDTTPQHSSPPQTFVSKPGQIILGKPMDNPVPLDQQMTHTKHHNIHTQTKPKPVKESHPQNNHNQHKHNQFENDREQAQNEIKSSDFMGESVENSTYQPAVNTGFKPDSIVIESGFKPIIREPLMAGEDRITDDGEGNANRREDTDVEEDYEEAPQYINHAYPSDKITESFEPMFIPSPEDHLLSADDKTKEIFPSNHAKEDRPHPVYVRTESELNALFSKKNMDKEVTSDMVMESNKVSPQYLPPDPKLPKEQSQRLSMTEGMTFTSYDGKLVSAATLTTIPNARPSTKNIFSSKLPTSSEQLLKTPQFGPFKGEIPAIVGTPISTEMAKELTPALPDTRTTRLKLVNSFHKDDESITDDLKPEASEKDEVKIDPKEDEEDEKSDDDEEDDEEEYEEEVDDEPAIRNKRESKTAQFERGEVEEQIPPKSSSSVDSQMDFEWPRATASSSRLSVHWKFYPVLLILKAFF